MAFSSGRGWAGARVLACLCCCCAAAWAAEDAQGDEVTELKAALAELRGRVATLEALVARVDAAASPAAAAPHAKPTPPASAADQSIAPSSVPLASLTLPAEVPAAGGAAQAQQAHPERPVHAKGAPPRHFLLFNVNPQEARNGRCRPLHLVVLPERAVSSGLQPAARRAVAGDAALPPAEPARYAVRR